MGRARERENLNDRPIMEAPIFWLKEDATSFHSDDFGKRLSRVQSSREARRSRPKFIRPEI